MARMTSLVQTSSERMADMMAVPDRPDVPGGLCLALTQNELDKLGLDDDVEVGDMLHLMIMVQATSVHKDSNGCRIECAIIAGRVEDESTEGMDDDEEEEGEA